MYSWSQNPVWIIYDILTNNTYGLGIPEDVIDFEDNLDDEEMIDRDKINDILEEFIKTNKSKYH